MYIEITTNQKHILSLNQQQSFRMLQMNFQELYTYMRSLSLTNPLIEITPPKDIPDVPYMYKTSTPHKGLSAEDVEYLRPLPKTQTLKDFLIDQILGSDFSDREQRELKWLTEDLDSKGYLPDMPPGSSPPGWVFSEYEHAVRLLQTLEPVGVGARTLSECLCIQLRRLNIEDELPYIICRKYLDRLSKGQLNILSRKLGVPIEKVQDARDIIKELNPIPSNGFAEDEDTAYIFPDLEISIENGEPIINLTDRFLPCYRLDPQYLEMSKEEDLSEESKVYFREKLSEAKWAISCVDRRKKTLIQCTTAIVQRQKAWFLDCNAPILPLTMTELSQEMGIHLSTLSRAVKSKYLICDWGVFPLSKFFVRELEDNKGLTGDSITLLIQKLISEESPEKPYTDSEIAKKLEENNIKISRRTVAKYRAEAMIPSAYARKSSAAAACVKEK